MEYSAAHLYWSQQNRNAVVVCLGKAEKNQLSCCGKGVVFGMEGTPGKWQEKVEVGD